MYCQEILTLRTQLLIIEMAKNQKSSIFLEILRTMNLGRAPDLPCAQRPARTSRIEFCRPTVPGWAQLNENRSAEAPDRQHKAPHGRKMRLRQAPELSFCAQRSVRIQNQFFKCIRLKLQDGRKSVRLGK